MKKPPNLVKRPVFVVSFLTIFNLFASGCSTDSNGNSTATESDAASLNDTGVNTYSQNFTARNLTDPLPSPVLTITPDSTAPNQDADKGLDADPEASSIDGTLGFQFVKLDANGKKIADQTKSYANEAWQCIQDNVTGLIWEVKTRSGLQNQAHRYTWYETDETINGGNPGDIGNNGNCGTKLTTCNTLEYITAVNALNNGKGLCGYNQWRLPLREELRSIIDYGKTNSPLIDASFFPNTAATDTWTSQTDFFNSLDGSRAWEIHFDTGDSGTHNKNSVNVHVRLVR